MLNKYYRVRVKSQGKPATLSTNTSLCRPPSAVQRVPSTQLRRSERGSSYTHRINQYLKPKHYNSKSVRHEHTPGHGTVRCPINLSITYPVGEQISPDS